ncbi:hypothetical protein [Flavobacterium sp. 123]|uniref:hypothetical protein n=1 Tax=Flavobacterium sp. 123 TaxID=2135627 RepID=UPI0011C3B5B6|nr:hypothetical protein [Flavobacterium sp. 123]
MKQIIYILALFGNLNCYSQDNSTDTISNNIQPELDRIELALLERNTIIDSIKIGSYISFYDIDNHGDGKWVNIYKGHWADYFGNRYFAEYLEKKEILNWKEWYEKYKNGTVAGEYYKDVPGGSEIDYIKYEGDLKGYKPNGHWTAIQDEIGIIVRGNFNEGKPEGEWTYSKNTKLSDGTVKEIIFRKEFYHNGIPDGKWVCSEKDLIIEENFVNGKPVGSRNVYYDPKKSMNIFTKGDLMIQSNFLDGFPDGQSYYYTYDDEKKKILLAKALYKLGKPIEFFKKGEYNLLRYNENSFKTEFIENSNTVRYHIYKKGGVLVKTIEFDRSKNNFLPTHNNLFFDDYSLGIWRAVVLDDAQLLKFGIDLNLYYK